MSEAINLNSSAPNDGQPSFLIQRIYLKELSLEQPNSPGIFLVTSEPQIQVELDAAVERLSDELFEVNLLTTLTARVDGKVLFLVEARQAGIFEFKNIPPEQIDPMLGITCPTILYPYLRSNIADITSRAGFQPIHLSEVNFRGMYEHRLAQAQQAAAKTGNSGADEESKIIPPN